MEPSKADTSNQVQYGLICVQSVGSLFPSYFPLLLCSSAFALMPQKPCWQTSFLSAIRRQSYLKVGEKGRCLALTHGCCYHQEERAASLWEWGEQETLAAGRSRRKGSGIDRKRNTHWLERAWEGGGEEYPGAKICNCNPMYENLLFKQERSKNIRMLTCMQIHKIPNKLFLSDFSNVRFQQIIILYSQTKIIFWRL